jgi:hypothetical protein
MLNPIVHAALRVLLHYSPNLGLTFESMRFEMRDTSTRIVRLTPYIA